MWETIFWGFDLLSLHSSVSVSVLTSNLKLLSNLIHLRRTHLSNIYKNWLLLLKIKLESGCQIMFAWCLMVLQLKVHTKMLFMYDVQQTAVLDSNIFCWGSDHTKMKPLWQLQNFPTILNVPNQFKTNIGIMLQF